jgi:hypothetical protein
MQKNKLMKGNKLRGHQAHLKDVAASFKRDQTVWDKLSKLTSINPYSTHTSKLNTADHVNMHV